MHLFSSRTMNGGNEHKDLVVARSNKEQGQFTKSQDV